jgi:hypothetical protein
MATQQDLDKKELDELISNFCKHDFDPQQDWERSMLGAYLLCDSWSLDGGLCLLSGFDYPARTNSAPNQPDGRHTMDPGIFQGHRGRDAFIVEELLSRMQNDLQQLRIIWAKSRRDKEAEYYEPAFFIEWALSKTFIPDWMDWATGTGRYIRKQETDKTPSPDFDKSSLTTSPELAMDLQAGAGGTVAASDAPVATVAPVTVIEATVAPPDAPVVPESQAKPVEPGSITARQVATFFDRLPYTAENWPKRLSDAKWLHPAKIAPGEVGGITSLWCPLKLAQLIHGRKKGPEKQKTLKALNSRFKNNTALQPWRDAWNEHYALFTDAIDD